MERGACNELLENKETKRVERKVTSLLEQLNNLKMLFTIAAISGRICQIPWDAFRLQLPISHLFV